MLLHKRKLRQSPHLGDKIITAWNRLMLTTLAKAGSVLGNQAVLAEYFEIMRKRKKADGKTIAYFCKDSTCSLPIADAATLAEKLHTAGMGQTQQHSSRKS